MKNWESRIQTAGVIALVALVALVFWELRQKEPVINLRLLKDRNLGLAVFIMYFFGGVLYGSTMLLPVFLQTLLGYTATQSGMVISPGGILVLFLMPVVGILIGKVEARWLVLWGILLNATGLWIMSRFSLDIDFKTAVMARTVQASGLAFLFIPINTIAFSYIPRQHTSGAAGLLNLARNIGGSTGIALVTTLIARQSQIHQNYLVSHLTPYDISYRIMLDQATRALAAGGSSAYRAAEQAQWLLYGMLNRHSRMLAFNDGFRTMAFVFLCMIPLIFLIKKNRPVKK